MGIRKEFKGKIRGSLEKNWEQFYEEFGIVQHARYRRMDNDQ